MRYVALVRGINVGGHRMVPMSDLRQVAAGIGLEHPRTLLQTGNLVFASGRRSTIALEKLLEEGARERLDLRTDFMVRSTNEWEAIVRANPFKEAAEQDPGRLVVMFLKAPVRKGAVQELGRINPGPEIIRASERELYIVFPDGQGRSRLPVLMTEARLGTRATARNWNTVLKLLAAVHETPGVTE
jgi:uncharacterized protein (DUF1697 family)